MKKRVKTPSDPLARLKSRVEKQRGDDSTPLDKMQPFGEVKHNGKHYYVVAQRDELVKNLRLTDLECSVDFWADEVECERIKRDDEMRRWKTMEELRQWLSRPLTTCPRCGQQTLEYDEFCSACDKYSWMDER